MKNIYKKSFFFKKNDTIVVPIKRGEHMFSCPNWLELYTIKLQRQNCLTQSDGREWHTSARARQVAVPHARLVEAQVVVHPDLQP